MRHYDKRHGPNKIASLLCLEIAVGQCHFNVFSKAKYEMNILNSVKSFLQFPTKNRKVGTSITTSTIMTQKVDSSS